ncbi:MAG TPA: amidophosphoribosyltransferase [bacterium]|nr:amidophosphoribosyltransferase [bacterium]
MTGSDDKPREFCGITGIYGHEQAAELAYLGLYALQHRGQEGAGIVSSDGRKVCQHRGRGLVNDVFSSPEILRRLDGHIAIGHNRYSTSGSDKNINVQPVLVNYKDGPLALGHNGNLVNALSIRRKLESEGALFQTTTDSEVIIHLIARSKKTSLVECVLDALRQVKGAYSLVIMTRDQLIVARDPHGFRPLALGSMGGTVVAASETCAMDLLGAAYERDVEPGELILINEKGVESFRISKRTTHAHCIFEFVYFSRPDSRIFEQNVDKTRRKLGKRLAEEHPAKGDIVISVPDSSNTAALGYAMAAGIPFELGLIRNHYIGRTFIQPQQDIRHFNVKVKFNPVVGVLKNKRIIVVEDSIVRGTTLRVLTQLLKKAGAREVHVRVSSPPIVSPCFYGMDFPTRDELIAAKNDIDTIREYLSADTLGYLSLEGLKASVPSQGCGYCAACFGGAYPVQVEDNFDKRACESC